MKSQLSTIAAAKVAPRSLDFIYLDARHDYEGVAEDLRSWWPALRPGGVLAGHDWTHDSVARALRDWLVARHAVAPPWHAATRPMVYVTAENPASWIIMRPLEALHRRTCAALQL